MPKITKHPRLRSHVRKGKGGQVWTNYYYDMRTEGQKDIPLGRDYAAALQRWDELHNRKPAIKGRLQEAFDKWRDEELKKYENAETRRSYAKHLTRLEPWCGRMTWDQLDFPMLCEYLDRRSAKTQGNREMSLLRVIWNRAAKWRMHRLPWPALGQRDWKNPEAAREFEVTDELFAAVYEQADPMLRDCMDIASATGMRLTDVRTILLPAGDLLRLKASKTQKKVDFDLSLSMVLPDLIARRRNVKARHLMLLSTPTGLPVSAYMLRAAWDEARSKAAAAHPDLADDIRAMYLRDMRKRASDLADDLEGASKLLQHSSTQVTEKHYRRKVTRIKPVR